MRISDWSSDVSASDLSGKTTLLEALLLQAGALHRKGSVVEGSSLGDSSPEARARQMTTDPNFAHCRYLDETWSFIECHGSVELAQDVNAALMAGAVALVVAPPAPARSLMMAPAFTLLDDYQIPHHPQIGRQAWREKRR